RRRAHPGRPRRGLDRPALRHPRAAVEGGCRDPPRRARRNRRPQRGPARRRRPQPARPASGAAPMSLHELTDDQREIRALARRFADEEVAPHAAAWDREHRFPREVLEHLGELGLMGVCVPEAHGGAGADFLSYCLVLEELSRADAGLGVTVAVHTSAGTLPILQHGTQDQIDRLVPPLAQGHEIAAFALTESGSGSDAGAMRTRADDEGRITGTKQWTTNGSHAHVFVVFARDGERPSAYVVRRGAAGFR